MSDGKRPTTRRDLMKPAQLLGLSFAAAVFGGVVTLFSMGFFQSRFAGEAQHALITALVVAGICFIVTLLVIALLLLAVQPAQITHRIDAPVLIARDELVAQEKAARERAARDEAAKKQAAKDAPAPDRPATDAPATDAETPPAADGSAAADKPRDAGAAS